MTNLKFWIHVGMLFNSAKVNKQFCQNVHEPKSMKIQYFIPFILIIQLTDNDLSLTRGRKLHIWDKTAFLSRCLYFKHTCLVFFSDKYNGNLSFLDHLLFLNLSSKHLYAKFFRGRYNNINPFSQRWQCINSFGVLWPNLWAWLLLFS